MEIKNEKNYIWNECNLKNLSVLVTSFLTGIYVGKKLNSSLARVGRLVTFGPSKLVLVARNDIKLGKGKLAAQCSHATLAAYKNMQKVNPNLLQGWEDCGQPKIVVRAVDLEHINKLSQMARRAGVETCLIHDAGRTQVGRGTPTVLAVGPASLTDIDKITGSLPLL